jgi:hypothetical protein
VKDLDRQILARLAHHVAGFLLQHDPGTVVGVDDVVADAELTLDDLDLDLDVLYFGVLYC